MNEKILKDYDNNNNNKNGGNPSLCINHLFDILRGL